MNRGATLLAVLAILLPAAGCDNVDRSAENGVDNVRIPPIAEPMARMPDGPIPAVFEVPHGRGPFPAVIILHGCGGRGASQLIWAHRLEGWGYATLIPDSMTPRGESGVCEPDAQELVTPRDRVGDVGSAAAWLRTRPEIDPNRIAVLGQSHGGATATLATQRIYAGIGLRAAINYYGPCVNPEDHGTVPVLVLVGEEDDWGHPAKRCEAYGVAVQPDEVFEIHIYPGVYHAFDNPGMVHTVSNSHVMEFNKAAAEDSFARVRKFLDRWVKR